MSRGGWLAGGTPSLREVKAVSDLGLQGSGAWGPWATPVAPLSPQQPPASPRLGSQPALVSAGGIPSQGHGHCLGPCPQAHKGFLGAPSHGHSGHGAPCSHRAGLEREALSAFGQGMHPSFPLGQDKVPHQGAGPAVSWAARVGTTGHAGGQGGEELTWDVSDSISRIVTSVLEGSISSEQLRGFSFLCPHLPLLPPPSALRKWGRGGPGQGLQAAGR